MNTKINIIILVLFFKSATSFGQEDSLFFFDNKSIVKNPSNSYISSIQQDSNELNNLKSLQSKNFYKQEVFNKGLIEIGDKYLEIQTNLSPGEYTLKVKVQNINDIWNDETLSQRLLHRVLVWLSWRAQAIYTLFILSFIFLILSLIINREKNCRLVELEKSQKQLKILNDRNELLSITDFLTGIYNRRYLDETLKNEISRGFREKSHISVMMIDVDYFKKYNDSYGHIQGDSCLIDIVNSIKEVLFRPNDFIARYGGEEFFLILPGTDHVGSTKIANSIMKNLNDKKIQHKKSPYKYVTISIGLHSFIPQLNDTYGNILQISDKALYLAKEKGRNRVEVI